MGDEVDRDLAQLAAMTAGQLNSSFASPRDRELMNQNKLDLRRFIPNHQRQHHPQARPMHHQPPYYNNPNEGIMPPPDMGGAFAPIPLPNSPAGLLPMTEAAMELVKGPTLSQQPQQTNSSFNVPEASSYPSFKDTSFSKPVVSVNTPKPQETDQAKIIEDLRKTVKSLSTKVDKMAKLLQNINNKLTQNVDE